MVKNYKKKPLNAATSGYTPPPPTGTPIYQPDEEAEIPAKNTNNLPPRRMNPPASRPITTTAAPSRPINANSVPPPRYQQNNNACLPNSLPTNYQPQYIPPRYNNQPQPQYNQPQYNQPQYGQPQYNQPQQYNQPPQQHYSPPQQYSQPPQQYNNAPPIPQRYHNSPPQQQSQNGPVIPPRKERYDTNYNTTGNPYYSEPTYRMPFPK